MKINSINSVYFGKKPKVNKDMWKSDSRHFTCPNNKESKVLKEYKSKINTLCKNSRLSDFSTKDLMEECNRIFEEKLDFVRRKKVKIRKFKMSF